jgi:hypothetical protein
VDQLEHFEGRGWGKIGINFSQCNAFLLYSVPESNSEEEFSDEQLCRVSAVCSII